MYSNIDISEIGKNEEYRWNKLLKTYEYANYRQSMSFTHTKQSETRKVYTFIFSKGENDIAGAHYFISSYCKGLIKIAEVASGFIFHKEPDEKTLIVLFKHFISWAKEEKASYIRINPWMPKTISGINTQFDNIFNNTFSKYNFKVFRNGRYTYWIDLTMSEQELLQNMNTQTRRSIRKALRSKLKLEILDQLGRFEFELFWNLYKNLGKTKGIETLEKNVIRKEIEALTSQKLGRLYILKCSDKIVNVGFASNFGIASYYNGALDLNYKKIDKCESPGHLSQWLMILDNKERGNKIYDMAFCPGAIPIKEHPKFGIWQFKYGFGGKPVEYLPTYGKILIPIKGAIFLITMYLVKLKSSKRR